MSAAILPRWPRTQVGGAVETKALVLCHSWPLQPGAQPQVPPRPVKTAFGVPEMVTVGRQTP